MKYHILTEKSGLHQNITIWDIEINSESLLSSDEDNRLLRLLGQEHWVDTGHNTSSSNGDPGHELVDLINNNSKESVVR